MPPKSMDRWLFGNFSHPAAQRCPGTLRQHLPPRCSPRKLGKKPPCSHTALQSPVARERCWQPSLSCPCEGNRPGRRCPGAGVPWQGGAGPAEPPRPCHGACTAWRHRHFQETSPGDISRRHFHAATKQGRRTKGKTPLSCFYPSAAA